MPESIADGVAESLVLANLKGHDSHGVIRVIEYIEWQNRGWIRPEGQLEVLVDRGSILMVDGNYQFGQIIGKEATGLAIAKAKVEGACILTIRRASHLGRIGEFMKMATDAGVLALSLTNTHGGGVLQAPYGSREPRLSANPVTGGIPSPDGDSIFMDFATCKMAEGKVKVARARGEQVVALRQWSGLRAVNYKKALMRYFFLEIPNLVCSRTAV